MTHHVLAGKGVEIQPFHIAQFFLGVLQAGFDVFRQVDLAQIARDDGFGTEAYTGQEHFHLFGRGVLRLVQNHIRTVKRAAAHIGQWGNFYQAFFQQFGYAVETHQIVQRVIQRAQVGINFLRQVAGQEAQFFACLDCRAHQHDAFDLVFFHRIDCGGHRQIGFTRTCRAQPEHDVVVQQGADVAVLARGTPAYAAAFGLQVILFVLPLFGVFRIGRFCRHGRQLDVVLVQIPTLGQPRQFNQRTAACVGIISNKGKTFETAADLNVQGFAQCGQMGIERPRQALQNGVVHVFELQVYGVGHNNREKSVSGKRRQIWTV